MADSTTRAGKVKMSLVFQKGKKYSKNDGNMSKGHKNQRLPLAKSGTI